MGELIDKAKGKAKEFQGKVTGDRSRQAEGVVDQVKGKAKGAFEDAKADVKRAIRERQEREKSQRAENPSRR